MARARFYFTQRCCPDPPRLCSRLKRVDTHTHIGFVKPKAAAPPNRQACWQQTQTWLNKWFTPTSLDFHSNALGHSEKVFDVQWAERTLPAAIGPLYYKDELSVRNNEKLTPFILLSSAPAYINSKGRSIPDKHLKKGHWPYLINDLCRGTFKHAFCILISQCLSYH